MPRRTKLFWIALLYISQGFPFGIITFQLSVYLRERGASLTDIGLMSLLTLPWSMKILWAPIVDRYGRKTFWLAAMQVILGALFLSIPAVSLTGSLGPILLLTFTAAMASATADIAIDGYTVQMLEREEMGSGNAWRLIGWKAAYILAAGGVGALATWWNWTAAYVACGIFLIALAPLSLLAPLPPAEKARDGAQEVPSPFTRAFWLEGYRGLFERRGVLFVFLFVLTYKLGTAAIAPMIRPFWVDRGYSALEIGLVSGTLGTLESFVAPLVGAWVIARISLFHALWVFGVLQVAPALLYAAVAKWDLGRPFIYAASLSESFDISLGQVAFMTFLTMICDKRFAATQYAFLSAIFGFTRSVAGWAGSHAAQTWDYAPFFTFTFFLGFVPFLFLPWVKRWIDAERADSAAPEERRKSRRSPPDRDAAGGAPPRA